MADTRILPVSPKNLDTTKRGGALKAEARYMEQWKPYVTLRQKYRPVIGAFSQHGCGGDHSGKTKHRAKTAQIKKTPNKIMVMKVNGGTGHAIMVSRQPNV